MPQFKFGRAKMKPAEEPGDFSARKQWAEAMAMPVDNGMKARPAESVDDFLARKALTEAQNREAVMTFVLGLVGDAIPLQYLNQPENGPHGRGQGPASAGQVQLRRLPRGSAGRL